MKKFISALLAAVPLAVLISLAGAGAAAACPPSFVPGVAGNGAPVCVPVNDDGGGGGGTGYVGGGPGTIVNPVPPVVAPAAPAAPAPLPQYVPPAPPAYVPPAAPVPVNAAPGAGANTSAVQPAQGVPGLADTPAPQAEGAVPAQDSAPALDETPSLEASESTEAVPAGKTASPKPTVKVSATASPVAGDMEEASGNRSAIGIIGAAAGVLVAAAVAVFLMWRKHTGRRRPHPGSLDPGVQAARVQATPDQPVPEVKVTGT